MSSTTATQNAFEIKTVKLGKSDLVVPKICLGTMTWGKQNTEKEAHEQLDYALSRGLYFIDTAEMYPIPVGEATHARTETYIGNWMEARGFNKQKRSELVLATKVAGPGRGMGWVRTGNRADIGEVTKKDIVLACEGSLQRLKTDYIDLYQIHWPARNVPMFGSSKFDVTKERESASIDEQLEAMHQLAKDGKIRFCGVSNETAWGVGEFARIAEKYSLPRIATIQNVFNLMSRQFEDGIEESCFREDVGLLAYSALAFGYLTGKFMNGAKPEGSRISLFGNNWPRYSKPAIPLAVVEYDKVAKAAGITLTQLALAFDYHRPCVASTIIGATSVAQLKECIDAYATTLSPETLAAIDEVHFRMPNPAP
jgi:aryl-alcohol dehydrogenase-like predicted oxidoreductase